LIRGVYYQAIYLFPVCLDYLSWLALVGCPKTLASCLPQSAFSFHRMAVHAFRTSAAPSLTCHLIFIPARDTHSPQHQICIADSAIPAINPIRDTKQNGPPRILGKGAIPRDAEILRSICISPRMLISLLRPSLAMLRIFQIALYSVHMCARFFPPVEISIASAALYRSQANSSSCSALL